MNNTLKICVPDVENVGEVELELNPEMVKKLAAICAGAGQTLQYLTEEMERLIVMTDNFAGLETEAFPLLRTMCEVKDDYRILKTMIGKKEVDNGRE